MSSVSLAEQFGWEPEWRPSSERRRHTCTVRVLEIPFATSAWLSLMYRGSGTRGLWEGCQVGY